MCTQIFNTLIQTGAYKFNPKCVNYIFVNDAMGILVSSTSSQAFKKCYLERNVKKRH